MINKFMPNKKLIIFCSIISFVIAALWPHASLAATAKDKYFKAENCYKKLRHSPKKQKYRENWLRCIKKFETVYRHDPSGPWAAAGLYKSGELYLKLYKHSFKKSDRKKALDIFKRISKDFPKSKYKYKAEYKIRSLSQTKSKNASRKKVPSAPKKASNIVKSKTKTVEKTHNYKSYGEKNNKISTGKITIVTGLRYWSNPSYTRVVIDTDRETLFNYNLLKKDPAINKPQRLYVDLQNSKLKKGLKKVIPINDNLLRGARAGQYTPDSVRTVIDIKSFKTYKIFSLRNPFRIVIDVWGTSSKKIYAGSTNQNKKISPCALSKQLALGVRRIILDAGHGGRDCGAPGCIKGVYEKDVVLKITKKLAARIRERLKCEVILTRSSDRYLTLEERTAIANTKNADLFISIHTNAHRNKRASGIETYFLNLATDDESIMVAARENATSTKNISDLQTILSDLMQNSKINESSRLAGYIQESMCKHLKKKYTRIKNKGVKQAPFYVLLGAQMPAVLIEAAFISNNRECQRLINSKYQDRLCDAIVDGIQIYIKETNPTAALGTYSYSPKG